MKYIYKGTNLAMKVEVIGEHQCVKIDKTGVWPLKKEINPEIRVVIGQLVSRKEVK